MNDGQETDREAGDAAYELYEKWTKPAKSSREERYFYCPDGRKCCAAKDGDCADYCLRPQIESVAAGQPLVEEFAGPVATRSGWFDRGRLQGLKEAAESVRDAWAKHAGKSFDQKFPSTTHECPKCKGFVESIEAIAALSSKPDKRS